MEEVFGIVWSSEWRAVQILAQSTLIWPLAIIKDLSGLRYVAMAGIGIIFYIFFAVLFEMPYYMLNQSWHSQSIQLFDGGVIDYITGFAISVFAYQSHTSFFPMRNELGRPRPYRINKIINRSVSLEWGIYELLMISGYLSSPGIVTDLIIERKTLNGGIDYPMLVAKAGLMFTLAFAIPINLHPTRENFFLFLGYKDEPSNTARIIATTAFIYISAIVAILLPDIYSAIAIFGGYCGTLVMITFPILMFTQSQKLKLDNWKKMGIYGVNILLTGLGFTAGTISLLKVIGYNV